MNEKDLTNHVFKNIQLNRTLIVRGDDGERVEIFSYQTGSDPKVNIGAGIFNKKTFMEKIEMNEITFERCGSFVQNNILK